MDPFTLSALIAAGGTLVSSLAGGAMSAKANKDSQNRAINAQHSLQSMLLSNSGTIMARNAKQAGLSPAFNLANSNVPTASSVSAPQTNYDFSSLGDLLGKIPSMKLQNQQYKIAKAQERVDLANAQIAEEKAKQEKINTENMLGKNNAANSYGAVYIDPDSKQVIEGLGDNNISEWLKSHPGISMPQRQEPVGYMGQLEFEDWLAEYEAKNSERSGRQNEVITQNVEREAREALARLNKSISEGRLNRPDIIESVVSLPKLERDSIVQDIRNKGLINTWQDLKNKEARESSLGRVIESMRDDSLSFGDKLLIALTYFGNVFIGNTSMSFSKKF